MIITLLKTIYNDIKLIWLISFINNSKVIYDYVRFAVLFKRRQGIEYAKEG